LGHQNIELLPEPYFHVVLLYPIVLILKIHQPKIVYTPCRSDMETLQQFSKTKEIQAE
jgi:hypothetical protein